MKKERIIFLWFQKCKRFFPYLLTSYLGLWCCMGAYAGFIKILPHLPRVLGELSLTYMSGLGEILLNRPLWYLSALLICNVICYPLLERRFELFVKWIAPITAFVILAWVWRTESVAAPSVWEWVAYRGVIRAIGCIFLGISLVPLVECLAQWHRCHTDA